MVTHVLPVLGAEALADVEGVALSADAAERRVLDWLASRGRVLVGYSGGVDSAYLAVLARRALGREGVLAVLGVSPSVPEAQRTVARALAAAHDVPLDEVPTDELADPSYAANPSNRCYFCKRTLWQTLVPLAAARGFPTVVDGTNADDVHGHRPGAVAADEQGVASPLALAGMTKAMVRAQSRALGLATWNAPAAPCLASRLPYGTAVTPARLRMVEAAEAALRAAGVQGNVRVRHDDRDARLELDPAELARWQGPPLADVLVAAVRGAGYAGVLLDLDGFRSGSLNGASPLRVRRLA